MAGAYVPQAGPPVIRAPGPPQLYRPDGAPAPPVQPGEDPGIVLEEGDLQPEARAKVEQEQAYRNWQVKQMSNERRNDFNSGAPGVNAGVRSKHDTDFILPDAYTTIGPVPVAHGEEFHGQFSTPMIGSSVPGFPDPRVRSVGLSNFSDLLPSGIRKRAGVGSMAAIPHRADLGDKLNDANILSAFRKLLNKGVQDDKDIDARQLDQFRRGWRMVGKVGQTF